MAGPSRTNSAPIALPRQRGGRDRESPRTPPGNLPGNDATASPLPRGDDERRDVGQGPAGRNSDGDAKPAHGTNSFSPPLMLHLGGNDDYPSSLSSSLRGHTFAYQCPRFQGGGDGEWIPRSSSRGRRISPAQGGRSPLAWPRPVRRRHRVAWHPGSRVPAQSTRPCPHPIDLRPAGGTRPSVHRRRSAADETDPRGDASRRRPRASLATACHRQSALCRRGDRGLYRADPCRSRGSRRCRHR